MIAQMLNKTTELLKYNLGTVAQPTEAEIRKDMNQLGVNYRGSSLLYYKPLDGDAVFVKRTGYNRASEIDALPGDRAPDAPELVGIGENNVNTSLFDIFLPGRHTVLVFAESDTTIASLEPIAKALRSQPANTVQGLLLISKQIQNSVSASARSFDFALIDGDGHAFRGYRVQGQPEVAPVVIVRPDGVIGARFRGSEGIEHYFHGIFNGPLPSN